MFRLLGFGGVLERFSAFVGLRYAGAKRRQQLVSFISGLSIAGMSLGVALLVVVLSVMNGFDRELREKYSIYYLMALFINAMVLKTGKS